MRGGCKFPRSILLVTLVFCCLRVQAAPGDVFTVRRAEMADFFGQSIPARGALKIWEGELILVQEDQCVIRDASGEHILRPGRESRIFVNGHPSCLEAARPVGPDAFFWARAWSDLDDNLVAMEAIYFGGELCACDLSDGLLTGFSPELGRRVTLPLAEEYRPCLEPGRSVYILLDLLGRIRSIFVLPVEAEAKQEKVP